MATAMGTTALGSMSPSYMFGMKEAPRFLTVTQAFYHHASKTPNAIAAKDLTTSQSITYDALARRSAHLAQRLQMLGVVPGARVPLVVKRGIDMLVGIVSILACGAQYVPLDGGVVPDSTLRFVIEQAGGESCTVLTLGSTRHRVDERTVANVVCIDEDDQQHTTSCSTPPTDLASPDAGCYVIYTSGTTGTPKGVDVTHRNVCNLVCLSPGDLGITEGTCVGQVLNVSFDMAAWEMLGCLCNAGTLILRGSDWRAALREVDVLISTPSILAKYSPEEFPNIKTVATAGEPSSQRLADAWASSATYYNCCGPTETTIVNTMHRHQVSQPLTIGKPTPNNNVYILDESLQSVPAGQPGVMWAGGQGVSRGYVGLPDKTAERYIADPFTRDGTMMYNTGDLGRWNADGSIHILGRSDDQVKFKGFRVELDGVTASLRSCSEVDEAVVLLIDDELHAFVTPATCDVGKAKAHLQYSQPYYAVPSTFHALPSLPLTPNGKIDKKALRESTSQVEEVIDIIPEKPKNAIIATVRHSSSSSSSSFTHVKTSSDVSSSSSFTIFDEKADIDLEAAVPSKNWGKKRRGLRHRILIVYRQLFSIVGLLNILAALVLVFTGLHREWLGNLTAMNLLLAVLIRQECVINAVYTITCSVPKSFPLWVRSRCARIFHLGGVHSAAAVSAGLWLLANNLGDAVCMGTGSCSGAWGEQSIGAKVVSWLLTALFIVMLTMAYPTIRKKHHDLFERTHRFTGWTMLGLFWVQVILTANDTRPEGVTLGQALLKAPPMWLLVVATLSIASSWFWLRKVPVEAEVLSDHAVRLHFDYTVPVNGSFTRLSRKPLVEWHSFATIPAPEPENGRPAGYSLVVSNAGDWTKKTIQDAPTHLWVRGIPTCGVMRIATLFRRIVVIGTGSGIGPLLGHIQSPSCPTQLIWSTKDPEKTFGPALVKAITDKIPGAVIHDTKKQGRPDLVKMGYNMVKGFGAEAVIIIANEKITKKVVYGLESRGVPAYGAIWDS